MDSVKKFERVLARDIGATVEVTPLGDVIAMTGDESDVRRAAEYLRRGFEVNEVETFENDPGWARVTFPYPKF